MKKFYITTPIYYVNDRPHIGHAYTTIMADVMARYYRFKLGEKKVLLLTGTDEHGAKVAQSAGKKNIAPQRFCDEVALEFKSAWSSLNISHDDFIRTTEERHVKVVREALARLKSAKTPKGNKALFKDKYSGLYCVGCESYKKESDLVDGKCPDHNRAPEFLNEENWYFRLSDYTKLLKEKINGGELRVLPLERKNEVLGLIEQGLEDVAISRVNIEWGVPLPFDKEQTVYVWIDALLNYISALGYPAGKLFKKFWPADVHFVGKDILKFHAVIWPALLIALGVELPKNIFAHGYFTLNGKKMSKSLGNVVAPAELVEKYGADAGRYLIISQFAFGQDGDVDVDGFNTKYNADLANGVGNLVSRVLGLAEKYCGMKVPEKKYNAELDLSDLWRKTDDNYVEFKIYENLKEILNVVHWCDNYIAAVKPWELARNGKRDELMQTIYNLLEIVRHLSLLVLPIMPETANEILRRIGVSKIGDYEKIIKAGGLKPGTQMSGAGALFVRKQ